MCLSGGIKMNGIDAAVATITMLGLAHYKVGRDEERRDLG
jgi:hypothetical protein